MSKRILVVEDDASLSESYTTLLKMEGYEIATAGNGNEAVKVAEEFKPNLILLDLLMPESTGMDFLKTFNPTVTHPEIKVIIFTNLDLLTMRSEAMKYGIETFITKSQYSPKELAELIASQFEAQN